MLKYLEDLVGRFKDIRSGTEKNLSQWNGQEIISDLDTDISELTEVNARIEELRTQYMEALFHARNIRDAKRARLKVLEKRIVGLHADEPEKLKDYYI